ncbi:MAG: prolyl oligopeptidase family serine peptidase [Planctomycetaceae bacterium]
MRFIAVAFVFLVSTCMAADRSLTENPELAKYFEAEVAGIERQSSLLKYQTLEQWEAARPRLREQLFDMLGLNPLPERTPLRPEITGTLEEDDFRVEKLHFQSSPGLYVTGSLYLPRTVDKPLPTVLYVCGHAVVKDGDISFGNKAGYQHHGAWYARNGYACLIIDTLQLGEIQGIHHGTYRHDRWWWNARGYTPAGVEAWNCMRALDYLETRPEVDAKRIGVTGRSGGGAYSWWIAATDDRIQCAVPVAGITSLRNHVVDGCVEGHCDCMYMVNTQRWDYATVAALVAPRPLLISNTDKDTIFPLEGVVAVHREVRHIYDLYNKPRQLGLQITEGPHKDTQELRIHSFQWMNRWLKSDENLIEKTAVKFFEPPQLRVFKGLPVDERNTTIDETFVPTQFGVPGADDSASAAEAVLQNPLKWQQETIERLRTNCFRAWPDSHADWKADNAVRMERLTSAKDAGFDVVRIHFTSQQHVPLSVDVVSRGSDTTRTDQQILQDVSHLELFHTNQAHWNAYAADVIGTPAADDVAAKLPFADYLKQHTAEAGHAVAVFAPRGVGLHAWVGDKRKQTQIERRFQLIGTTSDTMRIWDIRRAAEVLRNQLRGSLKLTLAEGGVHGTAVLLASLFDKPVAGVRVVTLNGSEPYTCDVLNLQKIMSVDDIPVALASLRCPVVFSDGGEKSTVLSTLQQDSRWPGKRQ